MDRERWQKVDRIVEAALDCAVDARAELLARECAGDESLRAEVESLLSAHDVRDSFLDRPRLGDALELLADRDRETLSGTTVGNYRLMRRLGRGGAGEVYLAQDKRLARPAAIKLLVSHCADNPEHVRRFRREALAASALNHPNILTIYEIGEWQGRDYIVAEFVDGMTLREHIRGGTLPIPACLDIATQIAAALAAAHNAGIVHRDIKPENIMLRPDGVVKVLDFGIAKLMEREGTAVSENGSVTVSGVVVGTAAYMSPEQARGKELDQRTDIWSLGVVLYELISGRVPFPGATPADHVAALLGSSPQPLAALRPDATGPLEAIVSRAMAKDRDERHADAAVLAEDLRKLRSELDTQGQVPLAWSWALRWRSRARKRNVVAGITLLLGIASAAGFYRVHGLRRAPDGGVGLKSEMIESLAVLPLVNRSGTPNAEYLSDGITDSLINDLSEIPGLKVMSRGSVYRYKGQNVPARDVGSALHVRAVLSGWIVRRSENLTVSIELVDARDSTHIWGERYDRKLAEIPDVQGAIAREIADRLRLRLTKQESDRLARRYTRNSGAYQLYLKGQFYWLKGAFPSWRSGSATNFGKSREFFEQAIAADPAYALGYSGLGHYYARAAADGLMLPQDGWPKAEAAFRKALDIDPDLPEARTGLAVIQWMDYRDWRIAERELRRAAQVNSNRPDTLYARLLAAEGRFDEAIEQARGALELDPLSIRYSSALGRIFYYARRYDESVRQYRHALELDPRDATVHEDLGDVYERLGLGREAVAEWCTAMTLAGDATTASVVRQAYDRGGLPAATHALARTKLQRFTTWTNRGVLVPAVEYARAYLRLGEREEAMRSLSKACDEYTAFVLHINVDPIYDDLHHDSRFRELVKRLNIPS